MRNSRKSYAKRHCFRWAENISLFWWGTLQSTISIIVQNNWHNYFSTSTYPIKINEQLFFLSFHVFLPQIIATYRHFDSLFSVWFFCQSEIRFINWWLLKRKSQPKFNDFHGKSTWNLNILNGHSMHLSVDANKNCVPINWTASIQTFSINIHIQILI